MKFIISNTSTLVVFSLFAKLLGVLINLNNYTKFYLVSGVNNFILHLKQKIKFTCEFLAIFLKIIYTTWVNQKNKEKLWQKNMFIYLAKAMLQ